jgi:hypothetical protein
MRCTVRTWCSCGRILACSCGYAQVDHKCGAPAIDYAGTVVALSQADGFAE